MAALAPVAIAAARPWTELNPWAPRAKQVGIFDEQPIPEILTTSCGGSDRSHSARTKAAVRPSWPHPAQSVDGSPS